MPRTSEENDILAVDPDKITALELISGEDKGIELRIFVSERVTPLNIAFADMKSAIRCYEELWMSRKLGPGQTVKIR